MGEDARSQREAEKKRGAMPEEQGGVGTVNSRGGGGWREKKSDEVHRKMKTVREITGKPGRMCNERRERGTGGGKGGGDEKEVISGLFLTAFCQPPSEIFRGETYRSCVLVKYQLKKKGCITAGESV